MISGYCDYLDGKDGGDGLIWIIRPRDNPDDYHVIQKGDILSVLHPGTQEIAFCDTISPDYESSRCDGIHHETKTPRQGVAWKKIFWVSWMQADFNNDIWGDFFLLQWPAFLKTAKPLLK